MPYDAETLHPGGSTRRSAGGTDEGVGLRIVDERLLTAKAAFGFWPASSVGDDIELYASEDRREVVAVVHTLRQQMVKPPGRPNLALADFTDEAPVEQLIIALSDPSADVRYEALDVLSDIETAEAYEAIKKARNDTDEDVRELAQLLSELYADEEYAK